jgi:hypothetical protein
MEECGLKESENSTMMRYWNLKPRRRARRPEKSMLRRLTARIPMEMDGMKKGDGNERRNKNSKEF